MSHSAPSLKSMFLRPGTETATQRDGKKGEWERSVACLPGRFEPTSRGKELARNETRRGERRGVVGCGRGEVIMCGLGGGGYVNPCRFSVVVTVNKQSREES
jgi:hypothetical protein